MQQLAIVDANNVVKVGDTPADIIQGISAGCSTVIGVCSGAFSAEELSQAGATFLVLSPKEILQLIQN